MNYQQMAVSFSFNIPVTGGFMSKFRNRQIAISDQKLCNILTLIHWCPIIVVRKRVVLAITSSNVLTLFAQSSLMQVTCSVESCLKSWLTSEIRKLFFGQVEKLQDASL
jgi:hypothetical protein